MRSILLVNVAQLHVAVHRFGCSTATAAKCSHLLQGSEAHVPLCFANRGLQQTPARQVRHLDAESESTVEECGKCRPRAGCRSKQLASALFSFYTSNKRAADILLPSSTALLACSAETNEH